MTLALVVTLAVVIQYVVERIKSFFPVSVQEKSWFQYVPTYVSLVISLICSIAFKIDILSMFGIAVTSTFTSYLSYIMTGVLISGGATILNELIKTVSAIKENEQNKK